MRRDICLAFVVVLSSVLAVCSLRSLPPVRRHVIPLEHEQVIRAPKLQYLELGPVDSRCHHYYRKGR